MQAIPEFPGMIIDWVPVDVAARAVVDIILLPDRGPESTRAESETVDGAYAVHNIVNPHRTTWAGVISILQAVSNTNLSVIPLKTWVHNLNVLAEKNISADELPGLRLLQFFELMVKEEEGEEEVGGSDGRGGDRVFETDTTVGISRSLRDVEAFGLDGLTRSLVSWGIVGRMGSAG